ncbi:MAG: hypothetical protein FJX71_00390 [Alphaproteobacteria bacterium]|nr:hypothetical protein [Alphaproteobacteria bacterium]
MTLHRYFVYLRLGKSAFGIVEIKHKARNTSEETKEILNYLRIAEEAFENAINYGQQSLALPNFEYIEALKEDLYNTQFCLLTTYTTLGQCVPQAEMRQYANKARKLCQVFNSEGKGEFYQMGVNYLKILEQSHELNQRMVLPRGSTRMEAQRELRNGKIEQDILTLEGAVHSQAAKDNVLNLKDKIKFIQKTIDLHTRSKEDWAQKTMDGLLEIEREIQTVLKDKDPSADISLEAIYEGLRTLLGAETVIDSFWRYIPCFVTLGNLEDGIARAEILKEMEKAQRGEVSYKTRFVAAALKNLKGDHAEWLEFEKELTEKFYKEAQKKKERKARAHQRKVEALKAGLAELKALEESQEPTTTAAKGKTPTTSTAAVTPKRTETDSPFIGTFDTKDEKQRKLERQQRHEEAEEKRKEEKEEETTTTAPSLSPTLPVEQPLSREEQRERILASSNETLAELYALSSRPLEVDREIENNTWKFTRAEFEAYLTAMGCECKSGKGIHTKADLPKATLVTVGDEIITILNDFGGALTLPLWDKDYVPNYLKRQILEARKNLRALKIAERSALDK